MHLCARLSSSFLFVYAITTMALIIFLVSLSVFWSQTFSASLAIVSFLTRAGLELKKEFWIWVWKLQNGILAHELFYFQRSKKKNSISHDTSPLNVISAQRTVGVVYHCQSNVDTGVFWGQRLQMTSAALTVRQTLLYCSTVFLHLSSNYFSRFEFCDIIFSQLAVSWKIALVSLKAMLFFVSFRV